MTYQVIIQRPAEKELDALQSSVYKRIVTRLLALEENPPPNGGQEITRTGKLSFASGGLPNFIHD